MSNRRPTQLPKRRRQAGLRGTRPTREAIEERMTFIAEAFAMTKSVSLTCRAAKERFGLARSSTRRYLDAIRRAWREAAQSVDLGELRQEHRQGIIADLTRARTEGKPTHQLWSLLLELDGLRLQQVAVAHAHVDRPFAGTPVEVLKFFREHRRWPTDQERAGLLPAKK